MSNFLDFIPTGRPIKVTTLTSGTGTFVPMANGSVCKVTVVGGGASGGCPTVGVNAGNGAGGGATVYGFFRCPIAGVPYGVAAASATSIVPGGSAASGTPSWIAGILAPGGIASINTAIQAQGGMLGINLYSSGTPALAISIAPNCIPGGFGGFAAAGVTATTGGSGGPAGSPIGTSSTAPSLTNGTVISGYSGIGVQNMGAFNTTNGGGGGGSTTLAVGGAGGAGGGASAGGAGVAGAANTGAGGGGGGSSTGSTPGNGGAGGSGIIIVEEYGVW